MNREIKFRGKAIKNKTWIYGSYVPAMDDDSCDSIIDCDGNWRNVYSDTIGQYTGLKDYDQTNEIWENDIVSNGIRNYIVKFLNGCFWMVNGDGLAVNRLIERADEIKVLGNIHDNLGLIK